MIYGYARVSSVGQSLYGTSLAEQEKELLENGAQTVFKDVFTGTSDDRPELNKLLGVIQSGDTLIVKKMDRLGRNAESIIHLIKELVSMGITVNILNMGIANNTMMGRFMVTILAGVAEFEHDMIVERFNEGKAARKAIDPDYREGRKAIEYDEKLFETLLEKVNEGVMSATEASRELGISRAKWYREVKKQDRCPVERKTAVLPVNTSEWC
jgi:DNA invertase Pin-like site-specific DNA recombinase